MVMYMNPKVERNVCTDAIYKYYCSFKDYIFADFVSTLSNL